MGDGGYLEIIDLTDQTLKIRYQGALRQLSEFAQWNLDGHRRHAETGNRSGS
jgi:hypothetical protein